MAATAQKVFWDISPARKDDTDKENNVPVLSLIQFSKAPFVSFGTVKIGTSKSAVLRIENPNEDVDAEVTVEKIASSKGFSVDNKTFTIEGEGWFSLTITWTPTEEGGVRELIIFNANGIVKHQAVLLGRAETTKKKKKTLWDSIKNKPGKASGPRLKKAEPAFKMSANKTFQVSRKPQYKRDRPRSPLVSLNGERPNRERSPSQKSSSDKHGLHFLAPTVQEDACNAQENSPLACRVPEMPLKQRNSQDLLTLPENKDLAKVLNKTLSPIGTPDRLKRLMPRIDPVDTPLFRSPISTESTLNKTPALSIKDALALIGSDLSPISISPRESSNEFSDSLESKSGEFDAKQNPPTPEVCEPRLTFFVSKKVVLRDVKPFTSTTVTKSKAPVETNPTSGRKTIKSRRRLLERTLELSDSSSQAESRSGTPCLPVIDVEADSQSANDEGVDDGRKSSNERAVCGSPAPVTFLVTSPQAGERHISSTRTSLHEQSISVSFSVTAPPKDAASPVHVVQSQCDAVQIVSSQPPAFLSSSPESFPVHVAGKGKKRKSEEFLSADANAVDAGKSEQVKRSRGVAVISEPSEDRRPAVQRRLPKSAGSVRSVSSLKTLKSVAPVQQKTRSTNPAARRAPSVKSSAQKSKIVAVAQSKLTFIKPQTAIPRHPTPFAAKNMFFDERWIEKQERGFTWWINYVLTPDEFKVNTEVTKVNALSVVMGVAPGVPKAPTKEEMSFSTYTARRKLNRLRRAACQLFSSELVVKAIQRLELEVEAKRLLVRKDRHLWKDIGERQKVLNWLLSYNPLWLRIGLETIFGELISLENNGDTLGLAMFILQRLLWNPDIAAEFRHAKVPHLYRDGHEEALSRFTLKKLLLLVCFLDKAKESRLIEHDPCLFCMDAEFKTSKDLLLAFSRDFLSGEGILPRHLGFLGLPVSHQQKPLDEFNFAVKNLAVDLKCGVRLVRVMELLVQDWSLSVKLRLPAISRLQKVHNVDLALQVLKTKGVDLKDEHGSVIDSRDIVDGHREKTLALLWKIMFAFHVEVILNEDQLKEEICFLRKALKTKRRLACLRTDRGLQPSPAKDRTRLDHCSHKIRLLMDWVRAVCDFYAVKVENFTVSFSDGRVLCYLIHHYHPSLVPAPAIHQSTTQTVESSPRGRLQLDCSDSDSSFDSCPSAANDSPFKELLENEKSNFRLVNSAVSFLGGVPAMINAADMSNTIPNEKVVMSYLSFLCTRLLDLRNETRAARVIQAAWRKCRLTKDLQLYQERNAAASKIQSLVRRFLQRRRAVRQQKAAVLIQAAWRGHVTRRELRRQKRAQLRFLQSKAATVIQAHWRMFCAMKSFRRLRYHTIVVQAQWRMRREVSAYRTTLWAVSVIQTHTRAWSLAKRQQECFLSLRAAAVKIQSGYRRWKVRKIERENRAAQVIQAAFRKWYEKKRSEKVAAAVKIQAWHRMRVCLRRYRRMKVNTVLIQAQFRGYMQRQRFQMLKLQHYSATVIQSAFRGHTARRQIRKMTMAAVVIQQHFRSTRERNAVRQEFLRMKGAAITLQAAYRGKLARDSLITRHKSATVLQTAFRSYAAQKRYSLMRTAAISIQQKYRATRMAMKAKDSYLTLRKATVKIQATWRGRIVRKRLDEQSRSAAVIQAWFRRHAAQKRYESTKAAALVIQQYFRAYLAGNRAREAFLDARAAAVSLQAAYRGMMVRKKMKKRHEAATVLQSYFKMFLHRKRYRLLQCATIVTQSRYRALIVSRKQQHEYRRIKEATLKIQAVFRGYLTRKELKRQHDAATAIQAHFRSYRIRMAFLAIKCAAVIIQERYRAKRLRDQQVEQFRSLKSAAVTIQAAFRGYKTRKQICEKQRAATVIQRAYRARNQFVTLKRAVTVCQRWFRALTEAKKQRHEYLKRRKYVICLQSAWRGHLIRKELHKKRTAATMIQSHFRKYQQQVHYNKLKWAAKVLQERFRANQKMNKEMRALKVKRNATVVIQAAFRGMQVRKQMKTQNEAAIVVQRAFKTFRQHKIFLALKLAAIKIQQRYRASVAARRERSQYLEMKNAAVVLQAAYRGHQVRKEAARWHQAATVVQSAFRKHREVVKYQAMRLSAIIIQRYYRSMLLKRHERALYMKTRQSVIVLQAAFRGYQVRKSVTKMHQAATLIQAHFKRYKQQSCFKQQHMAACVLQKRFRAQRQMKSDVQRYQRQKNAVIVLQAVYRGWRSRENVKKMHQAAIVLQKIYKTYYERRQYLALKAAVVTIQRKYRATVAAKRQKQEFQKMRKAAVSIQAAYRGFKVRKAVAQLHQAATIIQSAFRKHREEVKYQAMRLSAIIIQRHYRSWVLQKQESEQFLKLKHSAVVIQAIFRGHCARKDIAKMHNAATIIQANFRMHKQQVDFRRQCWAACVLQQRFRARQQMNLDLQRYQQQKKASIVVQASYRGMKSRRQVKQMHHAAAVIQRIYRAHCEHKRYQALKNSALTVQRRYRANTAAKKQMQCYRRTRRAAIVVQAVFRGHHVRKELANWHKAATVIQSAFRGYAEQINYQALRLATVIIQRRYRALVLQQQIRGKFLQCKLSAIILQSAFRGRQVRKKISRMHRAATVIQANFRRHKEQSVFQKQRWAACVVQQRFRAQRRMKFEMQNYHKQKEAVVVLQAAYRGMNARQSIRNMHQAATVIQSAFRKHREEVKYQAMRLSAIIIQRHYRSWVHQKQEREQFLKLKHSTVVIQAIFRGHCARKDIAKMHNAARIIQANFRMHKQQEDFRRQRWAACVLQQRFRARRRMKFEMQNFQKQKEAVVVLQAAYRGMEARQSIRNMHQAANVVQRAYKAYCQRKQYLALKAAVVTIQRLYRTTVAAKKQKQQLEKMRKAAVRIQAAYRGFKLRKDISHRHQAATVLQSAFRRHKNEVAYQAMRLSAILIQTHYRSWVLQRRDRRSFLEIKRAAVVLQAAHRGRQVRRKLALQNEAAVAIQSHWRRFVQRRHFQKKREAVLKLQSLVRAVQLGKRQRDDYMRRRRVVTTLQRRWRTWIITKRELESTQAERRLRFTAAAFHHLQAIKIQRALRVHWALVCAKKEIKSVITIQRWVRVWIQKRRYQEDRRKVVVAQRVVKRWFDRRQKSACVIQQAVRQFLLFRRQKRVLKGIVQAQALWRGYRSRCLNDNVKVVKLRKRLRKVTAGVREEDKLCNKTSTALDYLLRYKHFSYILEALKNLETATRLSPECCERLVESGATNVVFTLIRCCNRSVPCMDVITHSIQILLNLSKYHKTIEAVYGVESSVDTLLDLLQRYREKAGDKVAEKGGGIFTKACFLLVLLLQDKRRAVEVTQIPKAVERLQSIYRLTARKHKMDAERTVAKQKMNASINGSFYIHATPRKARPAPKFAPEWVLRKDKLKDIVDPLRAIQMVAETLAIAV